MGRDGRRWKMKSQTRAGTTTIRTRLRRRRRAAPTGSRTPCVKAPPEPCRSRSPRKTRVKDAGSLQDAVSLSRRRVGLGAPLYSGGSECRSDEAFSSFQKVDCSSLKKLGSSRDVSSRERTSLLPCRRRREDSWRGKPHHAKMRWPRRAIDFEGATSSAWSTDTITWTKNSDR